MKRMLSLILAVVLLCCCISTASALTLRKGSTGSNVKALQQALVAAGYASLKVDGKYGNATVEAVKDFQKEHNLKVDGVAGPDTLEALGVGEQTLRPGMTGPEVSNLQDMLATYNYPVGTTDGKYGTQTEKAVRLFQKLNGLKVDGVAGPSTLKKLNGDEVVIYVRAEEDDADDATGEVTACTLSNLTPVVGDVIRADVIPAGATVTYAWYRDGVKVAEGDSYEVTGKDIGHKLHAVATGTGDNEGSALSKTTDVVVEAVGGDQVLTGTALLKSRASAESTLGVTLALNTDQVHYKWYLNGTLYAETHTIVLTSGMIGSYVHVVLEAEDGSGYTGKVMSNLCYVTAKNPDVPVENVDNNPLAFEGTVTLPETVNHGSVMTARINVNCSRYTMAWYVDGAYYANTRLLQVTDDIPTGASIVLKLVPNTDSGYHGLVASDPCIVQ